MAEVQRRATSGGDLGTRERRKSGIFFFNRSFKNSKSSSSTKGEAESPVSSPTTPTLSATKDYELKRSASGRSIPALAQTSTITAEAEAVLSASPKSASSSLGEATQKASDKNTEAIPSEGLPTPPQTPGHSSVEAAPAAGETQAEEAPEEPEVPVVKKVSYHDDADLQVAVRESDGVDAIYSVRASVLESASTVWKQTLSSQPSTTLDLVADPAPGLDAIFSIAHYKFQTLPQQVSEAELHDIALVAEKYQTLHLLPPFIKGWLASVGTPAADADKLLVTAWSLGHAQWFSTALAHAAHAASLAADGTTLLDSEGKPWSAQPVSPAVVELLAATRAAAVERIIHAVSTPMHRLLNPERYPDEDTRYCVAGEDVDEAVREECEQLQLGSAIMGLTKARLWPAPEPARIRAAPLDLARAYREVRMRRYQTPGLRFQEGDVKDVHAQCGLGHHGQIEAVLREQAVPSAGLFEDLAARAKLAGVYSEAIFAGFESVVGGEAATPAAAPAADAETTVEAAEEQPAETEESA
ncbi:hypothetical protein N0V93_009885 [Gnomoniopsis smithogilvyi]|uniref:BTB domain-containing protein n=1 Tax=Gnomoniopsis smithogilvyi TaxID=1191159 RepID=A0A9W8YHY5_9PEZI|nr:hypothetical protein N0V93_009885 [Gnomoniopsis smithogilvyi]